MTRLIDADELKARIPTIEDEYIYVHKLIDNAPTVEYPFEKFKTMLCGTCQAYMRIEPERPQAEWVTDELCRLRSCLRSGTHVGSFLQTPAQMDRFIRALDEVIKPN